MVLKVRGRGIPSWKLAISRASEIGVEIEMWLQIHVVGGGPASEVAAWPLWGQRFLLWVPP